MTRSLIAIVAMLVTVVGGATDVAAQPLSGAASGDPDPRVIVSVSRAACHGCREALFDRQVMAELKDRLADAFLAQMKDGIRDAGVDPDPLDLHVESVMDVSEYKGRRLVVIRLMIPGVTQAAFATALVGNETVQVKCVGTRAATVPFESDACRRAVDKAFPVVESVRTGTAVDLD